MGRYYWVGYKVHLSFSVRYEEKAQRNFLANPVTFGGQHYVQNTWYIYLIEPSQQLSEISLIISPNFKMKERSFREVDWLVEDYLASK